MVGATPEDPRETCWRTWHEAMHYATDTDYRVKEIEDSAEPGW
jgi:hypothetical protein